MIMNLLILLPIILSIVCSFIVFAFSNEKRKINIHFYSINNSILYMDIMAFLLYYPLEDESTTRHCHHILKNL